jgi:hyperosmotically inducible protein
MSRATHAEEVQGQIAVAGNKVATPAEASSLANPAGLNPRGLRKAETAKSSVALQAQSGNMVSRSARTNQAISPIFQVSDDPRDQVQFAVHNGVLTVQGSVGTRELARQLVRKYARMPGIRKVRNQLTVRTNSDARIAVQLRASLSRDPDTHVGRIAVTVCDGVVFLSGAVPSAEESQRAEQLARSLQGVTRVNNGLRLAPQSRYPVRSTARVRTTPRR